MAVDLDRAVTLAASDVDMAVESRDVWQTNTRYSLVTADGRPAELVVIPDLRRWVAVSKSPADDSSGLSMMVAEIRVGRFQDAERELLFLRALRKHLRELATLPHLSDMEQPPDRSQ